tara:strand:+ start:10016 stop:10762 length:747 start_codon:yes stop_codon:yes gene_type:complete
MLDYLIVIPARIRSSRFPAKPLAKINGKELILHVLEKCNEISDKKKIIVATDSVKIVNFVNRNNYNSILTSTKCLTGTDRVSEVSNKINAKIYVNVQGDEPLINPKDIKKIILAKKKFKTHVICGVTKISKNENPKSTSIPKVVFNKNLDMIYMSRSIIPGNKIKRKPKKLHYWKQVCIYAFTKRDLKIFGKNKKKSYLEKTEDIEILRFLDKEKKIKMVKTERGTIAVDYPKDIKIVEKLINKNEKK